MVELRPLPYKASIQMNHVYSFCNFSTDIFLFMTHVEKKMIGNTEFLLVSQCLADVYNIKVSFT